MDQKMANLCGKGGEGTRASEVRVALDGPYGSLRIDLSAYSDLVFIAGGIGITPMLPIIDRLHNLTARDRKTGYSRLRSVRVVWACKQDIAQELMYAFGDRLHGYIESFAADSVKMVVSSSGPSVSLDGDKKRSRGGKKVSSGGRARSQEPSFASLPSDDEFAISNSGSFGTSDNLRKETLDIKSYFYVTPSKGSTKGTAPTTYNTQGGIRVTAKHGRPDISHIIAKASTGCSTSVGAVVCGPKAMGLEATKICYECNVDVHLESFEY